MTLTTNNTLKRLAVGAAMVVLLSGGVNAAMVVPTASTAAIAQHGVASHGADDAALHAKHGADDGVGHVTHAGDDGLGHV